MTRTTLPKIFAAIQDFTQLKSNAAWQTQIKSHISIVLDMKPTSVSKILHSIHLNLNHSHYNLTKAQ